MLKNSISPYLSSVASFILLAILFSSETAYPEEKNCLACHSVLLGDRKVEETWYRQSVHRKIDCGDCHGIVFSKMRHLEIPQKDSIKRIAEGLKGKSKDPIALASCIECHEESFIMVSNSAHGEAIFKKQDSQAAFCLDCHGPPHYIRTHTDPSAPSSRPRIVETCSRCHSDRTVASRYNLNIYVVESYRAHFHGKKYILGSPKTPECTMCHGSHDIRRTKDPSSPVYGPNKVKLCRRCHEGATVKFSQSFTHRPLDIRENMMPYYARRVMVILLIFIVFFMSLHILLDIYSQVRGGFRIKKVDQKLLLGLPKEVERLDIHYRIQHIIIFIAILYLASSGISLKYPDFWLSRAWTNLWGGIEVTSHLHRFFAILLIGGSLYHVVYIFYRILRRNLGTSIIFRKSDLIDFWQNIKFLSGVSKIAPRFDRFSYIQKLDYWIIVTIVLIMGITGVMYWFPTIVANILPSQVTGWIWGVAYVIHSTEALLVLFFGFVWHFYNVHLKSRVFPMSWVWITGKISTEDLLEEHPKEFEKLFPERGKK
jgi:cytochrome b subunit of formate dehydrogenase